MPKRNRSIDEDTTGSSGSHKKEPSPLVVRDHIKHWFTTPPRPMHILLVVVFVLFGMAVTTQVKATVADPLDNLSEEELVTLIGDLQQREDELRSIRAELQTQVSELQDAATSQQASQDAAKRAQTQSQILAGTVPVTGPGIILWVTPNENDIPASAFVTTLAELRNAGAEAIELNEIRLSGRSWIGQQNGKLIVDNVTIEPPYVWRAIGDPSTLSMGLSIRGGAVAQLKAFGASVSITESTSLDIDVVASPTTPIWAEITTAE